MVNKYKFCPLCGGKLIRKNHDHDEYRRLTCKNCGFIVFQNPTPTVLAIIERQIKDSPLTRRVLNQILLVKRAIEPYKGYWDLPGGFVELGQNLEIALKKEIKEETNLQVASMKYFDSFIGSYRANQINEPVCCSVFKVTTKPGQLKPGSDVSQVKWFTLDKLPKMVPQKDVRKTMKKFLSLK